MERVKESGTSSIGRRGKGVLVVTRVIFIECIEYVERGGGGPFVVYLIIVFLFIFVWMDFIEILQYQMMHGHQSTTGIGHQR